MCVCARVCLTESGSNPRLKLISLSLSPGGLSERQQRGLTQLVPHANTHTHGCSTAVNYCTKWHSDKKHMNLQHGVMKDSEWALLW